MRIYDFEIEYREEPTELSVRIPRFSWKLEAQERDTVQRAYGIQVFSGEESVWDSGRQDSPRSVLVPYGGKALEEETDYRVNLWVEDNHGNIAESQTRFSTGIFDAAHFRAEMITHDFPRRRRPVLSLPAPFPWRSPAGNLWQRQFSTPRPRACTR